MSSFPVHLLAFRAAISNRLADLATFKLLIALRNFVAVAAFGLRLGFICVIVHNTSATSLAFLLVPSAEPITLLALFAAVTNRTAPSTPFENLGAFL